MPGAARFMSRWRNAGMNAVDTHFGANAQRRSGAVEQAANPTRKLER